MQIRTMLLSDLPVVLELNRQLGYESELTELHSRYVQLTRHPEHGLYVGDLDGKVIGFLHLRESISFVRSANMELAAIVVAEHLRGQGFGKQLLDFSVGKARERGFPSIFLSSREARTDAHRFYENQGFLAVKNSLGFLKELRPSSS